MSSEDGRGSSLDAPPYGKVLTLGAIAAATAFVVTILIVLVCVGCQRKSKSKHPSAGEKGTSVNLQGTLRHPKLNPMSKSDTRLHEINRYGNGVPKNRPASMDLLLLHAQGSRTDLRTSSSSPSRQLPQAPSSRSPSPRGGGDGGGGGGGGGEVRDHTYTEVGLRSGRPPAPPARCQDDGLYESVGVREGEGAGDAPAMPPAPPLTSAGTPAAVRAGQSPSLLGNGGGRHGNGNGDGGRGNGAVRGRVNGVNGGSNRSPLSSLSSLANQEPPAAEYASIHKYRKGDKATRKENGAADSQSNASDSPSAHPPPLHRSQELPRKPLEPFHLHSFPKEAVFIGNGEQYIWKPPGDDDIITLHPTPPQLAEGRRGLPPAPTAKEIADTYSTVCKPAKRKEFNGAKTLPRSFRGDGGRGGGAPACSRGRGVQAQARSHEEPCYQPSSYGGDRSWSACVATPLAALLAPAAAADLDGSEPAYGNIEPQRKRDPPAAAAAGGAASLPGGAASLPGGSATLKRKKPPPQPPQPPQLPPQPPPPAPAAPHQAPLRKLAAGPQGPACSPGPPPISGSPPAPPPAPPPRALPGGENFYESIGEGKGGPAATGSGTTTIFTFHDGMEMYVTGL